MRNTLYCFSRSCQALAAFPMPGWISGVRIRDSGLRTETKYNQMKTLLRMIIAEIDFDKGEHEPYRIPWKYSFPRRTGG